VNSHSTEADRIRLRPATAADLGAVERLLHGAGLPTAGLADQFPSGFVVAESGVGVVGAAGIERHGRSGLLRSVVVSDGWQGHGLGAALTDDRIRWARSAALDAVYLLTTTAAAFFPRLGFRPVERDAVPPEVAGSSEFSTICPSTAAVLRLVLAESPAAGEGRS
jgi:N-acetylglutamate synthase-like GNAT family acetyltransferase